MYHPEGQEKHQKPHSGHWVHLLELEQGFSWIQVVYVSTKPIYGDSSVIRSFYCITTSRTLILLCSSVLGLNALIWNMYIMFILCVILPYLMLVKSVFLWIHAFSKWLQGSSGKHGEFLWQVITLWMQLHLPVNATYVEYMVGFWNKCFRDGEG